MPVVADVEKIFSEAGGPSHIFRAPDGREYECLSMAGRNVYGDQPVMFREDVKWTQNVDSKPFEVALTAGKKWVVKGAWLRRINPEPSPDINYRYFDITVRPLPPKRLAPRPFTPCHQCLVNRAGLPGAADPAEELREAVYEVRERHHGRVHYVCYVCANRSILATLLMGAKAVVHSGATGAIHTLPQLFVPAINTEAEPTEICV